MVLMSGSAKMLSCGVKEGLYSSPYDERRAWPAYPPPSQPYPHSGHHSHHRPRTTGVPAPAFRRPSEQEINSGWEYPVLGPAEAKTVSMIVLA